MSNSIWDRYDYDELAAVIGVAARLQVSQMVKGQTLDIKLPCTHKNVSLPVIATGNIDTERLHPIQIIMADTIKSNILPGIIIDINPLLNARSGNYLVITFEPEDLKKAASERLLEKYSVSPEDIEAYTSQFIGKRIPKMNMKFLFDEKMPEVLPASDSLYNSVGMNAAASGEDKFCPIAPGRISSSIRMTPQINEVEAYA